jgi:hypothetical protein
MFRFQKTGHSLALGTQLRTVTGSQFSMDVSVALPLRWYSATYKRRMGVGEVLADSS